MDEIQITDQTVVSIGDGISLHPRGLAGTLRVDPAPVAGARAFGNADPLLQALAAEGLQAGPTIVLPAPGVAGARTLGGAAAEPEGPSIDVDVTPGRSCLLLVEDTNGAVTWVLPNDPSPRADEAGARALTPTSLRFTMPAAASAVGQRGFVGDAVSKAQTFFFDTTDALLGPIIHGFARKWEARHRPGFTRSFTPDDYRIDDPAFERLGDDGWRALQGGLALLFVHGTFSTSGAFAGLAPDVVHELSQRYGGRMFAFNHPTMTADPRENALAFLGTLPQGVQLEVDIVCHSRGGLVAREIQALGSAAGSVHVRRIVFVGATNAGTALADGNHIVDMVSRFTTIAKVIPAGPAKAVVDALVLAVKVLGHGLLSDLEGLAAMNPHGTFITSINVPGDAGGDFFAIASDFEPKPGSPFISLRRAEDAAADRIFGSAANDLVVPRDGVFAKNGAGGFPIVSARCLQFGPDDAVVHTEFFAEPRTGAQLLEWLGPDSTRSSRDLQGCESPDEIARIIDLVRNRLLQELPARTTRSGGRALVSGAPDFTPEELDRLRPHVINLSAGAFKPSGIYSSTPEDVDAIVQEHIPRWADGLPAGEKLRIVVWAHGGLIGEKAGLRIAQKHVEWWKKNGVYPIYFVWETGLFDALRAILEQVRSKIPGLGGRDLFDFTSDPLIELGARALGGVHIWGAMKRNAELASADSGGARYVARRLALLAATPDLQRGHPLELHAIGHSAGSIFHSWFLPAAKAEQVPPFKTLQLLAPAITVAEFDARLVAEIGGAGAAERAILYTMKRHYEEADNCAGVYRKSLLYLIHHALEPEKRMPVLGLEISLRADPKAARLFGLQGAAGAPGRAVWSVTDDTSGRSASAAVHHGDFDDDIATMGSVAANLLDAPQPRVPYPGSPRDARAIGGEWLVSDDWLRGIDVSPGFGSAMTAPASASASASAPASTFTSAYASASAAPAGSAMSPFGHKYGYRTRPAALAPSGANSTGSGDGARRALCVGIDKYQPPNRLAGCVNDTESWSGVLKTLDFEVRTLLDEDATRQAIIDALTNLVQEAQPGDVLVFQYAGHGTQVQDFDGDEHDGTDEALVPFDFDSGAFLIDDDLRGVFSQLRDGVNLTCFIDCCHSGTITRMLGRNTDESTADGDTRSRYLKDSPKTQDWMRAHERFRQRQRSIRAIGMDRSRTVGADVLRWITFSACDATEVAYETQGHGDFTTQATAILSVQALQGSNRDFQDAVIRRFGERRRQTPQLDATDGALALRLLNPLV